MNQKVDGIAKFLQQTHTPPSDFYFPHMKYGKVLVSPPENQKFFLAFFHFLGLIIPKKHV
jgi:hypothetical protein